MSWSRVMTLNRATSRTTARSRSVKASDLPFMLTLLHASDVWQWRSGLRLRSSVGLAQQTLDVTPRPRDGFDEGIEFRRCHRRHVWQGRYSEAHGRLTAEAPDRFTSNEIGEIQGQTVTALQ